MKIAGVVVLYNPNIKEVVRNILSYTEFLEKIYIVDNSKKNNEKEIKKKIGLLSKMEYIWFGENKGIAKALNEGKNRAILEEFEYLLTMDQDSYFDNNLLKLIKYIENNKESLKNIGIISPNHLLRGRYHNLQEKIEQKKGVMTSGNFLNLDIAKNIGDFNEEFFIDEVDAEYCYRLNKKGYKITVYHNCELYHNLGDIKWYFFIKVTNHNYIRRYYITRNKLYMMKTFSEVRIKYFITFFYDLFKIVIFEKDKKRKLNSIRKGILDFFMNKTGKYEV